MQNVQSHSRNPWMTLVILAALAHGQARQDSVFKALLPMGGDTVVLLPANERVKIMATLQSKGLEGVHQIKIGADEFLRAPDGSAFKNYPRDLTFRITVGENLPAMEKNAAPIETSETADEFKTHLRFRLKVFKGLDSETLQPSEVKMIGVPVDIPYDERVYSVKFRLPKDVPSEDRLKLEIHDSKDNLVTKFQVQLL